MSKIFDKSEPELLTLNEHDDPRLARVRVSMTFRARLGGYDDKARIDGVKMLFNDFFDDFITNPGFWWQIKNGLERVRVTKAEILEGQVVDVEAVEGNEGGAGDDNA